MPFPRIQNKDSEENDSILYTKTVRVCIRKWFVFVYEIFRVLQV